MKYLTLDYIKEQSRIDFGDDDELLSLYAEAAETATLNYIGRSVDELKKMNGGTMPVPVVQATLMIVDHLYQQRSPTSSIKLSSVPYTFDFLVLPYVRLTNK